MAECRDRLPEAEPDALRPVRSADSRSLLGRGCRRRAACLLRSRARGEVRLLLAATLRRRRGGDAAMTASPEARLLQLGIELGPPPPPVANYVGAVQVGELLFVSGHGPYDRARGEYVFLGKLGRDLDVETGQMAARLTILNLLASVKA